MASKAQGVGRNGRDSNAKRLGVKAPDSMTVKAGAILVRQKGTRIHPGLNVKCCKDFTLMAMKAGIVKFNRIAHRVDVIAAATA